jgi:uncharacterized membrane protein YecN with MAPEG domain
MTTSSLPNTKLELGRAQFKVGLQIALSVPLQIAFVHYLSHAGIFALPHETIADRIAFTLRWELLAVATLLSMIAFIAGARPLWKESIRGDPDAPQLERHLRVQRNTLEQLVVMVLAHLALATLLPVEQLALIPTLVILFVLARIAYWIGYTHDEMHRTVGFVATFYPNIYALGLALWLAFK